MSGIFCLKAAYNIARNSLYACDGHIKIHVQLYITKAWVGEKFACWLLPNPYKK